MKLAHALAAVLLALLLAACGQPVPADKSAYVGDWRSPEMRLVITREGHVRYERRSGSGRTSIDAPLQGFDGDNFSAGVGFLRTTFVVTKPPYREGTLWKMVVDGVEVVRAEGGGDSWNA
jgi:hypothetical protein